MVQRPAQLHHGLRQLRFFGIAAGQVRGQLMVGDLLLVIVLAQQRSSDPAGHWKDLVTAAFGQSPETGLMGAVTSNGARHDGAARWDVPTRQRR